MTDTPETGLTLFHYTCAHGRAALGDELVTLRPMGGSGLIWATDLDVPYRDALGLTSHILKCDRTEHRYLIVDTDKFEPWHQYAHTMPWYLRERLEAVPGAMPMHWWVAPNPVAAYYNPLS